MDSSTIKDQTVKEKQVNVQSVQYNVDDKDNKSLNQRQLKQTKAQQLRQWMTHRGCLIHPSVKIPSYINGYQGVGTTAPIPPRTLIIAIPSSLILTVSKCYNDPQLRSIFTKNDKLFDYESADDAEFNVLCVFMMYHKMNIENSEWRVYLETIGEPQTAVDWADGMLKGLNKSVIEQIIHVRIQCDKLRQQLSTYLKSTRQFSKHSLQQIKQTFDYCYRAVMTRCFGYYFGQSSLIPIADLINHGCQAVDHQLINVKYEKNIEFNQSYTEKSDKIDLSLLGIKRGRHVALPFREKFLIQNQLIQNTLQHLSQLNRQKIDQIICAHNDKLFRQNDEIDIEGLEFCEEDDSEDNDTDVDEQHEREAELERMHLEEVEQVENFNKYLGEVRVETYKQVQQRFNQYEQQLNAENQELLQQSLPTNKTFQQQQSRNNLLIKGVSQGHLDIKQQSKTVSIISSDIKLEQTTCIHSQQSHDQETQKSLFFDRDNQGTPVANNVVSFKSNMDNDEPRQKQKAIVPIKLVEDSAEEESEDEEEWGLFPDSYFTMSTGSAVGANKQLFNSYGSRTNRFLLIWYGFCYRNNLFDSVSLRIHVQFQKTLPSASQIVLDTYVGGQGRSFRKNQKEIVQGNEVSRQFRLKQKKVCMKLLTFLRLYLLEYYKGSDLYKICVTIPSSVQFQLFVLAYYKEVVIALYQRYPLQVINELKQQMVNKQTAEKDKVKINFKIIYLEEQRRLLDANVDTVEALMSIWENIKKDQKKEKFSKQFYSHLPITQLRKLKHYLQMLKSNYPYVIYRQD